MDAEKPKVKRRAPNRTRTETTTINVGVGAGDIEAATPRPPDADPDGSNSAFRMRRKRTREAVASTQFTTYEACVTEWLFSDNSVKTVDGKMVTNHMYLRSRFEHGIGNAPDSDTLHMAKALVEEVLSSLVGNSAPGIAHIRELFEYSRGLNGEHARLRGALEAHEQLLTEWNIADKEPDLSEQLAVFKWRLRVFDERFLALQSKAEEVLSRIDLDSPGGGKSKLGARGSLARLMAMCGAFGCNTAKVAKLKIERAVAAGQRSPEDVSFVHRAEP